MNRLVIRFLYIFFLCILLHTKALAIDVEHIEAKSIDKPLPASEEAILNAEKPLEIPNPFDKKVAPKEVEAQKVKTEVSLKSDKVFYNQETNEVEAVGNVSIITMPDNNKVTAQRAIYSRPNNTIKLFGDVVLYKDGGKIVGDYMSINLADENVLINEPNADYANFKITAKEGHAFANQIVAIDGELRVVQDVKTVVESHGFGRFYDEEIFSDLIKPDDLTKKRSDDFKIRTGEIIIIPHKDHDEITFKNADLYYKKFKLATASDIQIYTDKEQNYVEANVPELGSISDFGSYVGYGKVFKMPYGGTIKVVPVLVEDDGIGIGAIVRMRSQRNKLHAGWASSSENLVVRGKYKFNKDLWIDYGRHAYFDEWFFGHRRPGYIAQLVYHKAYDVPDLRSNFTHRITAGYVADYAEENDEQEHMLGTMRFRYQAELSKDIYQWGDTEQDVWLRLQGVARAAATLYGTGHATGFVGIGPYIKSRVNRWGSIIGININGTADASPLLWDDYTYGKISIYLNESIKLHKYLSIGYRGMISPLKDNYKDDLITENRIYVMVGPEDTKVMVAHDTIRKHTTFDFLFLLGSDKFSTKFDKLTVKDPAHVARKKDKLENIKFIKLKVPEEKI